MFVKRNIFNGAKIHKFILDFIFLPTRENRIRQINFTIS